MLDLVPIARDAMVRKMADGMLVNDARRRVVRLHLRNRTWRTSTSQLRA